MSAETSYSPPAWKKVLGNDDLLGEILHRVDSPTTLVRAAAVAKRWLRVASGRVFLRRYRARHPPCLLGFFVTSDFLPRPEFVPMNTDLTSAAVRRAAGSVFDTFPEYWSCVWDSRNGRVLLDFSDHIRRLFVRDVLQDPAGAMTELPPRPPALADRFHAALLPDAEDDDDATCYLVDVQDDGRSVSAEVTVLRRSGAWSLLCSAKAELAAPPGRIPMVTLLAGGKVYNVTEAGYIVCVDLATARLFAVDFPDGVTYDNERFGCLVPCRGDDSVLYLFHVEGDKLSVWLRRMDQVAGEWVLRDTVSVKETCGDLIELDQGSQLSKLDVVGVGDNAEFAFLELGVGDCDTYFVVYLHLGSRKTEMVYQRDRGNDDIIQVYPFTMVWPPVFPALASDEGDKHL
ncbi:hypothetical protein PR202_ga07291 [Eleusine coracana subsp. coracana]|uniref:F-box protein AT5G49610-like beta-propeller domain-containing protein n=1 Tax=Eleusine coracana subsp. coracana TaxID=191504 RepID=A0AAV5BX81_ELECO|nr:hypothetical protein QOZ80_2AG0110390 [Eleusine coracana subsp. coracana]GJM90961.1 hypothetical protein PR202_ga07291 [Eleusine coracana subsp. coracana]